MINLERLTRALARVETILHHPDSTGAIDLLYLYVVIESCKLASQALDVMMRRRWGIFTHSDGFQAHGPNDFEGPLCADPFTALVSADELMKTQEKAKS